LSLYEIPTILDLIYSGGTATAGTTELCWDQG